MQQQHDQQLIDRILTEDTHVDELAARRSLRSQIARLEHELSEIVASKFPHIPAVGDRPIAPGPMLLDLEALERSRDRLAARVQDLRRTAAERVHHERRARELLERMKLEPGRYKFVRLPVTDLGQGGCGVWEVRPRLGLIGMLAGWWQLTLSSGCPLVQGRRESAAPMDGSSSADADQGPRGPGAAAIGGLEQLG